MKVAVSVNPLSAPPHWLPLFMFAKTLFIPNKLLLLLQSDEVLSLTALLMIFSHVILFV